MRYIARFWWILALTAIGASFMGSFVLRYLISNFLNSDVSFAIKFMAINFLAVVAITIIAAFIVTQIFIYVRYYKHFFTDEGYLTFTLPVSRRDLLLSKMVNAFFWTVASYLLSFLCVLIFAIFSPPAEIGGPFINPIVFEKIGNAIVVAWKESGLGLIIFAVLWLATQTFSLIYSISLGYFCIALGSTIAKKHKIMLAIGLYYAISIAVSIVKNYLQTLFVTIIPDGLDVYLEGASDATVFFAEVIVTAIPCCMMAALAFAAYSATRTCIERKLNLA